VFYTNYPDNEVEQSIPFTVTITDPCDNPVSMTASDLTDESYTIT